MSCEYCKQMAQLAVNKMNFTTICTYIQLILYWQWLLHSCSTRIQHGIIGVQIAALKLTPSNET